MSVLVLFTAILVVLVISIIFAIVNWIFQAKLSSRIAQVEEELEKKNLEFDAFKKERGSAMAVKASAPAVEMSPQLDMPISQQTVEEGSIQIVRNVRGTFEAAPAGGTHETAAGYAERFDAGAARAPAAPAKSWPTQEPGSVAEAQESDDTKRWANANQSKSPPAATAPRGAAPSAAAFQERQPPTGAGVVLPLFSAAAGRADFNLLYNTLMNTLKTRPDRTIAIDCSGVQTLGGQELDYLEKLHLSLKNQGRSLVFVHCAQNLAALLQCRSSLAASLR
jgi:hypothetical protein